MNSFSIAVTAFIVLFVGTAGLLVWSGTRPPPDQYKYEVCMARGLEYYKNSRDFPYLTNESHSTTYLISTQVEELCRKNAGSFGPLDQVAPQIPTGGR